MVVIGCWILLSLLAGGEAAAGPEVFQIRFHGGGEVLAQERPLDKGARMVFRCHPDGAVVSVKKSDIVGVTAVSVRPPTRSLRPGEQLDVGPTGEGTPRVEPEAGSTQPPPPGAAPQMFTQWGTRWIPGYNRAFPPASATQRGPGDPPMGAQSGPPPARPN